MKKDIYNNIAVKVSIPPQFVNSNTTLTGTGVDTKGYESVCFAFASGTQAGSASANVHTFEIQESDSSDTGFTAVADADLLPTTTPEASAVLTGATDNTVTKVGYIGAKRYVRAVDTVTGFTTAGGSIVGLVILSHANIASTGA